MRLAFATIVSLHSMACVGSGEAVRSDPSDAGLSSVCLRGTCEGVRSQDSDAGPSASGQSAGGSRGENHPPSTGQGGSSGRAAGGSFGVGGANHGGTVSEPAGSGGSGADTSGPPASLGTAGAGAPGVAGSGAGGSSSPWGQGGADSGTPNPGDGGLGDAGSGDAGSNVVDAVLTGPTTLAAGGIALLRLPPEALFELRSVSIAGIEWNTDDGERTQFVLVPPELDNPPADEVADAGATQIPSLPFADLSLEQEALDLLPEAALPLLRVAVRIPASVPSGHHEIRFETTLGVEHTWPIQIIDDVGPFVPPSPAGIIWPAMVNDRKVFPIGTRGPYHPLVDPIFPPAFPSPEPPLDVTYDFRLQTLDGQTCVNAAPRRGLVVGEERIEGVGANPLEGFYDIEAGNFVEITIDRTPMGGSPELYRGGWVTGTLDAVEDTQNRGQLAPPQPGNSFVALRAVRTGLPLVFNYLSTETSIEEACPSLVADAGASSPPRIETEF